MVAYDLRANSYIFLYIYIYADEMNGDREIGEGGKREREGGEGGSMSE